MAWSAIPDKTRGIPISQGCWESPIMRKILSWFPSLEPCIGTGIRPNAHFAGAVIGSPQVVAGS